VLILEDFMSVKSALAFVAVRDLKSAKSWYEKLLGKAPDTNPMDELYEWQFPAGWLQLVEDKTRAGSSSVTLVETDFEKRITDLEAAGLTTQKPMRSEQLDIVILQDPDGNQIVFAHGKTASHRAVA
jgi:hypothetical protein